jgi:inner membrane protein
MDPLTHTLVGASLAATELGKRTSGAAAALVVGANLPDVDVLSYVVGSDAALGFRRGWTHGILALAILPALLALVLWLAEQWRATRRAREPISAGWLLALSYLAVLTHPAMDWLNTYGMRWLMPFRDTWFYGDAVFIVDPWLWMILGVAWLLGRRPTRRLLVVWAVCAGLLLSVVGARASSFLPVLLAVAIVLLVALIVRPGIGLLSGERVAKTGLVLASLYVLALIGLQAATERKVRFELGGWNQAGPEKLMVGPVPVDPLVWDVVVKQDGVIRHGRFVWRDGGSLLWSDDLFRAADDSSLWEEIQHSGQASGFMDWVRFPWLETERMENGTRVYLMDGRYVRQRASGFGAAVIDIQEP